MSTITCTSCNHPNPPGSNVCQLCGAPLLMTHLASQAPIAANVASAGLHAIGGSAGLNSVTALVFVNAFGMEEFQRRIDLPSNSFKDMTIGWTDFQSGHFPSVDLAKLFNDVLIMTQSNGQQSVAVSRRTGTLRRDQYDDVYLSCDLDASSLMWAQLPGSNPRRVLPGDEVKLEQGMYLFLGKNSSGITFVVR